MTTPTNTITFDSITTPADSQIYPILLGLARHMLTTLAGGLVAKGWLDSSEVELFVAALLVLGGMLWSALQKLAQAEAQRFALATARAQQPAPIAPAAVVAAVSAPATAEKPPGTAAGVGPAVMGLLLVAMLGCVGCETKLYGRNGKAILRTHSDSQSIYYSNGYEKIVFYAVGMMHSVPTLAGGKAFAQGVNALGSAGSSVLLAGGSSGVFGQAGAVLVPTVSSALTRPSAALATPQPALRAK